MPKGLTFFHWKLQAGNKRAVNLSAIRLGLVWALGITAAAVLVLGLWVLFNSAGVYYFTRLLGSIALFSVAAGGIMSGRVVRNLGWLHGGLVGFCYGLAFILPALIAGPLALSFMDLTGRLGIFTLTGLTAGVIGVNLPARTGSKKEKPSYKPY